MLKLEEKRKLREYLSMYKQYHVEKIEREVELINNSSFDVNSGIRSKNKVSRTTEDIALLLASDERLLWLNTMIKCIDELRIMLLKEPIKLIILENKFLNNTDKLKDEIIISKLEERGYPMGKGMYYKQKADIFYDFEKLLYHNGIEL